MLVFFPTEDMANQISKDRLTKMFQSIPELWDTIDHRKSKLSEYYINGVRLGVAFAGSKSQVASTPSSFVLFDEIDRADNISGEGSPWELTKVRGATFPNFKLIGNSTPTGGIITDSKHPDTGLIHWDVMEPGNITSKIWALWQEGTRHEFMIPCSHCNTYFTPKMKLLYIADNATSVQAYEEAALICPHCGALNDKSKQRSMIQHGKSIAPGQWVENDKVCGDPPNAFSYTSYVGGLCSLFPNSRWQDRALTLQRAKLSGDLGRLKGVINTNFGELDGGTGERPSWEDLKKNYTEPYARKEVPNAVKALTCYTDIQGNRLVYTVCGWSLVDERLEMYVIDYGEIYGDTFDWTVWNDLDKLHNASYGNYYLSHYGVDSGFNPSKSLRAKEMGEVEKIPRNIIYEFKRQHSKLLITKGSPRPMNEPWTHSLIDVNDFGRHVRAGIELWKVDTDFFKTEVYARLGWDANAPGRWYFPHDTEDEFFKQITSEWKDGQSGKWVHAGNNHYLDCLVGNLFLAFKAGYRRKIKGDPVEVQASPKKKLVKRDNGWGGWG